MFTASRLFAIAAALAVAAPLAAQQASRDSTSASLMPAAVITPVVATQAPVGPVLQTAAVSPRVFAATNAQPMALMPSNGENSNNVALMFVGGAGLIVGALIGGRTGTIVMLGSGILGLVGLFHYLQ